MSSSLREVLTASTQTIGPAAETPWLDAMILAEWATGCRRSELLASMGEPFEGLTSQEMVERFHDAVRMRARGLPVARIVGSRAFWEHEFSVGPGVLIPRPESEHVVEAALACAASVPARGARAIAIHDAYTGSGCIGISVAHELAQSGYRVSLTLSDSSEEALDYARTNARRLLPDTVEWSARAAEDLRVDARRFDLITANPPYLTRLESDAVAELGWDEPRSALDGGEDGLAPYRTIAATALDHLLPGGYLVLEHGAQQRSRIEALLIDGGMGIADTVDDLAGIDRVVVAVRT